MLREEVVTRVEQLKEEKDVDHPRKTPLGAFLERLLWPVLENEEILRRYGPFLSKLEITPDSVLLRDNRENIIVELVLKEGDLFCLHDERSDCVHVGFAWALPEVYKAMDLHGRKKPDIQ